MCGHYGFPMRKGLTIAVAALVALGITACGSDSKSSDAKNTTTAPSRLCTADDVKVTGAAGEAPKVTIPTDCSPTTELITKDLVAGPGPEVKKGSAMDTHYLLMTWSDQKEADSSWSRGKPFPLQDVGNAPVIEGWNEGLVGMKEGGRRLLIVPSGKGYGEQGTGPIKAGETLVFVVDAVKVT